MLVFSVKLLAKGQNLIAIKPSDIYINKKYWHRLYAVQAYRKAMLSCVSSGVEDMG